MDFILIIKVIILIICHNQGRTLKNISTLIRDFIHTYIASHFTVQRNFRVANLQQVAGVAT